MKKAIGIFDSGVGGLTVYKTIRNAFPSEDLIYFGDTARVPYGPKSPNTIIEYSLQNARFLLQQGIKILIVACNTSSAVALPAMQTITDIPIIGVIEPGAEQAAKTTKNKRIGIIGTEGTINSEAYPNAIKKLIPEAVIFSVACPLFVPLVEEGWQDHLVTELVVKEYLTNLKMQAIDTLVLGCTHYPLLSKAIQQIMGSEVTLVDSAMAITEYLARYIGSESDKQQGSSTFYVSDNEEKFTQIAERILNDNIKKLIRVRLYESWFQN